MSDNLTYLNRYQRYSNRTTTGSGNAQANSSKNGNGNSQSSSAGNKNENAQSNKSRRPFLRPHHQTNIMLALILVVLIAILFQQIK